MPTKNWNNLNRLAAKDNTSRYPCRYHSRSVFRNPPISRKRPYIVRTSRVSAYPRISIGGPFGEVVKKTGTGSSVPFRFSTKYQDDETGLAYYGYRYYQPSTGRWVGREPIGEQGSANLECFVGNNPQNYFDILGLYGNPVSGLTGPVGPGSPYGPGPQPPGSSIGGGWQMFLQYFSPLGGGDVFAASPSIIQSVQRDLSSQHGTYRIIVEHERAIGAFNCGHTGSFLYLPPDQNAYYIPGEGGGLLGMLSGNMMGRWQLSVLSSCNWSCDQRDAGQGRLCCCNCSVHCSMRVILSKTYTFALTSGGNDQNSGWQGVEGLARFFFHFGDYPAYYVRSAWTDSYSQQIQSCGR